MTVSPRLSPRFSRRTPSGDEHERSVCDTCGFIDYDNPKIVVGAVVLHDDSVLLCRRAIAPRKGYWTLPAGFMEKGETPAEGAAREAYEEARARLSIEGLLGVYTIRHIGQVQMIFRATLAEPGFSPGPESEDVRLFPWDALPPPEEIAFPSVFWALDDMRSYRSTFDPLPRRRATES